MHQKVRPLQAVEFVGHLAKSEPVFKAEEDAYHIWYAKTPTGKKRNKFMEGDDDDGSGKKEKKKGGKKKK